MIAGTVAIWAAAQTGAGAQEARWLISFETLSSVPPAPPNISERPYGERAAVTRASVDALLPEILLWADGSAREKNRIEGPALTPGGYELRTSPSVQLVLRGAPADASRLGAAVGFVFRQWAVLISNADAETVLGNRRRQVGLVRLERADQAIDADLAQAFFVHAAATDKGLGLGYTSFGKTLLFLNLRDATGKTSSGLNDLVFAERLKAAASGFAAATFKVSPPIVVDAWLIENDWGKAPNGEQYARLLGSDLAKARAKLIQARADAVFRNAARRQGWR